MVYVPLPTMLALVLVGCAAPVGTDGSLVVRKYLFPSPTATLTPTEEAAALYYQFQLENELRDLQPRGLEPPSGIQQRQRLETGIELHRMDGVLMNNRLRN
jgi:hypothetical protein